MSRIKISYNGDSSYNNLILSEALEFFEYESVSFNFERVYMKDFEQLIFHFSKSVSRKTINSFVVFIENLFSRMENLDKAGDSRLIDPALLGLLTEADRFTDVEVTHSDSNYRSHFSVSLHKLCAQLFSLQREYTFSTKDIAWLLGSHFHVFCSKEYYERLGDSVVGIWDERNVDMKEFLREKAKSVSARYVPPSQPSALVESQIVSQFQTELAQVSEANSRDAIFAIYEMFNMLGFNTIESWYLLNIAFYGSYKEAA